MLQYLLFRLYMILRTSVHSLLRKYILSVSRIGCKHAARSGMAYLSCIYTAIFLQKNRVKSYILTNIHHSSLQVISTLTLDRIPRSYK